MKENKVLKNKKKFLESKMFAFLYGSEYWAILFADKEKT